MNTGTTGPPGMLAASSTQVPLSYLDCSYLFLSGKAYIGTQLRYSQCLQVASRGRELAV